MYGSEGLQEWGDTIVAAAALFWEQVRRNKGTTVKERTKRAIAAAWESKQKTKNLGLVAAANMDKGEERFKSNK